MSGPPPPWQFAVAAYTPLLTANLSVIGSFIIIRSILIDRKKKLKDPRHRMLLAMSTYDILYSLAKAWTFVLAPAGVQLPGALGNMHTCRMQGFFIQIAHASGSYNALLSLYYWLTICHRWKPDDFARHIEYISHVVIFVIFYGLAILGVYIKLYNPAFGWCFIAPYPPGCGSPDYPCERFPPEQSGILYELFANGWVQIDFVIVLWTNILIWWNVREQMRKVERYTNPSIKTVHGDTNAPEDPEAKKARRKARKARLDRAVAIQCSLFVGAFLLCWIGPMCFHIVSWVSGKPPPFWSTMVLVIFTPTQGMWNAIIYCRPAYIRLRKKYPEQSRFQILRATLSDKVLDEMNKTTQAGIGSSKYPSSAPFSQAAQSEVAIAPTKDSTLPRQDTAGTEGSNNNSREMFVEEDTAVVDDE